MMREPEQLEPRAYGLTREMECNAVESNAEWRRVQCRSFELITADLSAEWLVELRWEEKLLSVSLGWSRIKVVSKNCAGSGLEEHDRLNKSFIFHLSQKAVM